MNKKLVSFVFAALLFTLSCYSQEADGKNSPSLEVQAEEPPQEQADISVENEQQEKKKSLYFSSKDEIRTRIISVDLDYLFMGLKNSGWGLGIYYEQYIWNHLASKICFGHSTFCIDGDWCPTVSFGMFAECYPFQKGLDGLYIAFGGYFDFIELPDSDGITEDTKSTYLSIYPLAGYKLRICKWLSTDIFCGYKHIFTDESESVWDDFDKYIVSGVKAGVAIKFHFFQ